MLCDWHGQLVWKSASGDRLLISLLLNTREKKSFLGLGGEATVHIWGKPALDQGQQILRLTDIELAVESEAAFGLLSGAATGGETSPGEATLSLSRAARILRPGSRAPSSKASSAN